MQLKALWDFMQIDIEADKFAEEMRKSPNRQKLIKYRSFLMEQQENMKKIEADIAVMQDRLEAVRDEATRLEGVLSSTLTELSENPPADAEEIQRRLDSVKKLSDTLARYEQELTKMRRDADNRDRQQRDIRIRSAKAKQEYDQVKQVYDKEYAKDTQTLTELRAKIEKEAARQDTALLSRYKTIKQHCTPPMAKLSEGQCCGCFMQLPSATLRRLQESDTPVECDNCGRILYIEE